MHWADEATLDVLRLLGRRIATVPALLVATYRDDELDRGHPLRVALGELARRDATGRLRLVPLSVEAVAELAAPYGVDAAELHRRTAGNPFFVTEALAAGGVELPATVRDAVLARVAPLSPPARRLLDAAAIVPGPVELPLLEALAGDAARASRGVPVVRRARLGRPDGWRSGTISRASPSRRRSRPTGGWRCTAGRSPRSPAAPTRRASPTTPRAPATPAPCCASRPPRPSARRRPAPTARPPPSTRAPCASPSELEPAARAALLERRSHECYIADQPREAIAELAHALDCHRSSATAAARATRCARCRASSGARA